MYERTGERITTLAGNLDSLEHVQMKRISFKGTMHMNIENQHIGYVAQNPREGLKP